MPSPRTDTSLLVRGRRPRTTAGVVAGAALAAAAVWMLAVVAARFVVFQGFELAVFATVGGVALGAVATRHGGSLAAAVLAVFAPNAALQWTTGGVAATADSLVVAVGTVLYVSGSVAVAGGLLAYAVGVRWRTGAWAQSLRAHLGGDDHRWRLLGGWTALAAAVAAGSVLAPSVVSLGVVQFVTLVGGLLGGALVGRQTDGLDLAVAVGVVAAGSLAVAWSFGVPPGPDPTVGAAVPLVAGLVGGAPVGAVGYLAGQALRADAGD